MTKEEALKEIALNPNCRKVFSEDMTEFHNDKEFLLEAVKHEDLEYE